MPIALSKETLLQISVGTVIAAAGALIASTLWVSNQMQDQEQLTEAVGSLKTQNAELAAEISGLQNEISIAKCRELEVRRSFEHNLAILESLITAVDLRFGGDPAAGSQREHISTRMAPLMEKAESWNQASNC